MKEGLATSARAQTGGPLSGPALVKPTPDSAADWRKMIGNQALGALLRQQMASSQGENTVTRQQAADSGAAREQNLAGFNPVRIAQRTATPTLQRQEAAAAPAAASLRTVFPFPTGSRIILNRIMPDVWFRSLSALQPELGAALNAVERQTATVTVSEDELFSAVLSSSVTLPAAEGTPERTLNDVTLEVRRQAAGTFDLTLFGRSGADSVVLFQKLGLTASAAGGATTFSTGAVPELRASPGQSGQVRLEAYTAPYLSEIPDFLRGRVPERIELLQLTSLPAVPAGTAAEQQAITRIADAAASQRRERGQQLSGAAGLRFGTGIDPVFSAAWQVRFRPIPAAGNLLQVPLEVQLQYAPPSSLLAGVSSGVGTSLSQFNIPVNIRFMAGVAGGSLPGEPRADAARPLLPAFGPTLGAGVGLELGAFRAELRYEHLFNLVSGSPNANSLSLGLGAAF